jgi:MraZ protein
MARFTGTFVNRIDAKGRLSVPAPFRSALGAGPAGAFYLRPSHDGLAIDGLTEAYMDDVQRRIDAMAMYSSEREQLEMREFADAIHVQMDPEGRIGLPRTLTEPLRIAANAAFVGLGSRFQIWEPTELEAHKSSRRADARGLTLASPGTAAAQ